MFRMRNANCRAPPEDERFIREGDGHRSDGRLRLPAPLALPLPSSSSSSSDLLPGPPSFHLFSSRDRATSTTGRDQRRDHDHDRDQLDWINRNPGDAVGRWLPFWIMTPPSLYASRCFAIFSSRELLIVVTARCCWTKQLKE